MGVSRLEEPHTHLKMKLLILCLFGVALATASFEVTKLELGTHGYIEGLVNDYISGIVEKVKEVIVARLQEIAEAIGNLIDSVMDIIKTCIQEKCVETVVNELLDELKAKILEIVDGFVDVVLKEVIDFISAVIDQVGEILEGWDSIKEKIFEWIDQLVTGIIDSIMSVLRAVLEKLNDIEGKDWDGFIEEVMAAIKEKLDAAFAEVRQKICDKIGC